MDTHGFERLFRGLIIAFGVCALLLFTLFFLFALDSADMENELLADAMLDAELMEAMMLETESVGRIMLEGILSMVCLGGYIAGLIGMYFFQRWARSLFVVAWCAITLFCLVMDGSFSMPMEAFLESIMDTISGALLVLAFLTPVADRFELKKGAAGVVAGDAAAG